MTYKAGFPKLTFLSVNNLSSDKCQMFHFTYFSYVPSTSEGPYLLICNIFIDFCFNEGKKKSYFYSFLNLLKAFFVGCNYKNKKCIS